MADLGAGAIIDLGKKLVKALKKVKTNNHDGHKIRNLIDLVNTVCLDVRPLHEDGRIETDPKVALAMESLKDALEEAEREVTHYLQSNIIMQAIRVDAIAKMLASLRQQIKDAMYVSMHAILNEANRGVKENRCTLQGLDLKLDALVIRSGGDGEREQVQNKDTPSVVVLTETQLRARQQEHTASVSEVLSIPLGVAAVLLRRLNWAPDRVQKEWFTHGQRLRRAVGLPPSSDDVWGPKKCSPWREGECNICFDAAPKGTAMISAGCSHYYCKTCWRSYISAAVRRGPQPCLSLRCPDPSCKMPVIQELVDMVELNVKDRDWYAMFARWSYVDNSGGRMKWCPGPGCGRAIEHLGAGTKDVVVVACDLKHSFCWGCGQEPHRPLSCDEALVWLDTVSSGDWLFMFAKRCPNCRKTIMNDTLSNNVTCSAPCCHRFCWLCLQQLGASNHTAGCYAPRSLGEKLLQYYGSQATERPHVQKALALLTTKKEEKHKAVTSSHYKLWAANQASLQEMDVPKSSELSNMASALGIIDVADLNFLSQAYEAIAECRRAIRWVYPYGYYHLDPKRDQDKCERFDRLHKEANDSLQRLQVLAEERFQLYNYEASIEAFTEAYTAFKTKVLAATKGTRHKVETLVKVVEIDLQE